MMQYEIMHGDALGALRAFPDASFSAVVTDPPYSRAGGASHTTRTSAIGRMSQARQGDQFWGEWFARRWSEIARVTAPDGCAWIFCDWRTISALEQAIGDGWTLSQVAVWDRDGMGLGSPLRAGHELIAFARGPEFKWRGPRDVRNVFRAPWPYGGGKLHGAEKPVALLRELIRLAGHGSTASPRILDPFAGSGSTIKAAQEEGVAAFGVELDAEQAIKAAERCGLRTTPFASICVRRDDGRLFAMDKREKGWSSYCVEVPSLEAVPVRWRVKPAGAWLEDEHGPYCVCEVER